MTYEIEVKSLLGSRDEKERVRGSLPRLDPRARVVETSSQRNHYFFVPDTGALYEAIAPLCSPEKAAELQSILAEGREFSVRTRLLNDQLVFVIKASIEDTNSVNGITRREFEVFLPEEYTLDTLDERLLNIGCSYHTKWSREREAWQCQNTTVCLDYNAGYGYVAEFERVVSEHEDAEQAKRDIYALMEELGVIELPVDRLERMFQYYTRHWPEYYGTNKIFTVY